MKFDFPSFLLGCGTGAGMVFLGKRLRPLMLELATVVYRLTDSVMARAATEQEEIEELLAEARTRTRRSSEFTRGQAQAQV